MIILILIVGIVVGWYYYRWVVANRFIDQWADHKGYNIVSRKYLWGYDVPGVYYIFYRQFLYEVITDDGAKKKKNYIIIGDPIWGMLRDKFEVVFEEDID